MLCKIVVSPHFSKTHSSCHLWLHTLQTHFCQDQACTISITEANQNVSLSCVVGPGIACCYQCPWLAHSAAHFGSKLLCLSTNRHKTSHQPSKHILCQTTFLQPGLATIQVPRKLVRQCFPKLVLQNLHHPRNGAPHVQVLRLPMHTFSYTGFFFANDGSGGIASSFSCKDCN